MLTTKEFNEITNKARITYNRNGDCEEFQKLCNYIFDNASIKQIIIFVHNNQGVDVKRFGVKVATLGDAEQNFEYACISGSDSRLHRDKILESKNIEYNIRAGKQIKDGLEGEYVNKHGEIVVAGNSYENFKYLKHNKCKTLNKQPHFDAIIKSNNTYINLICAKEIEGADVWAHGKVILDSKEVATNMAFARIQGAHIQKHLYIVAQYGSAYDNFEVLQNFDNCNRQNHIINIFLSKDNDTKYECLMWLKNHNLLSQFEHLAPIKSFVADIKSGKIQLDDLTSDDTYNCY